MIELVYLENGKYIKKLLQECYNNYIDENYDSVDFLKYEQFVERVFKDVINWYTWDRQEDNKSLELLGFDVEKAEDLLDSISGLSIHILEDWSMKFEVEYYEHKNAIIVRAAKTENEIILPDPSIYAEQYAKMHKLQLTKIARLLNELRTVKDGNVS